MISTQVLPQLQSIDDSEEENISGIVGFIIVGDKKFEVKKGETKIGRDPSMCSIVIENFTISKVHAVIESEGIDDTFIYDVGSTNQTKLKKKVLKPHCRYKLDSKSKLIFGNVAAKFILPYDESSDSNINPNTSDLVNLYSVEELGDIFDLATQVTAPQSTASNGTLVFEKHKGNFSVFKIPNLGLSERTEKSGESLRNSFDEMTKCKLNFEEETSRTASHDHSFEKFDIFSLKTQCQIYETSITEENKCEAKIMSCDGSNEDSETNKIKFLLNDGQDDVLCSFMSLHSPKGKNNDTSLVELNIKTEVKNLSQELDLPSQIQIDVIQEPSANYKTEVRDFVKNKNLSLDFFHKSTCEPSITSTPLNKKCKFGHSDHNYENNYSFIEHEKEDFIMTQEFNVGSLNSNKKSTSASHDLVSLSQDQETQPYLKKTLHDFFAEEPKNINEDLIPTQNFENLRKSYQNIQTNKIISETNELIEMNSINNQVDSFEKKKQEIIETSSKNDNTLLSGNSNKNVESHLSVALDFIQKTSTQIFEETTNLKKDGSLKQYHSYYDEDFISTQPVQLPLIKAQNSRSPRLQNVNVKTSPRESSPDLLGIEDAWENPEDCIATQKFEISERRNIKGSPIKFNLQTDSYSSCLLESEKHDCSVESIKVPKIIDSSGDETESDLEILFDDNEKGRERKFSECALNSFKADSESESGKQHEKAPSPENDSNFSYVFELKPENHLEDNSLSIEPRKRRDGEDYDSDATDCEELGATYLKTPKKLEPSNRTDSEKNQINLIVSHNFSEKTFYSNDDWMNDKGSPKFDLGKENSPLSPLSLEMPSTQEIETTVCSLLQNKIEKKKDFQNPLKIKKNEEEIKNLDGNASFNKIDFSERQVDSLLKRPLDSNIDDTLPLKKPKNEILDPLFKSSDKQFSRLVKAHDIAQIQPSRTRNSLKLLTTGNNLNKTDISLESSITNERPTSRRKASGKRKSIKKSNGNITPYLITKKMESRRLSYGGRKKEIFSIENKVELKPDEGNIRILRSSKRNNGISVPSLLKEFPTRIRKSKRNFRTKSGEYFNSSCINIVFTGFECESLDKIICDLGGKKTNDLSFGEVVVADKVRRTVKFLCAIGLSLPITSPQWLISCKKKKKFLNPWNFILKDEESEEKWGFELKTSLEKSRKMKLLQGFNVFVTKSTKPPVKDMLAIVECCGGTPLLSPPDIWPKNTIIVTCLEDKKWWPLAKFRNVKVVHYEFIMSGVLKQQIDFKTYRLR